jgi:peptide/nickel transport system substrate-binding protein
LKWHDGRPVTAEDVKFTFDYYKEKGQPRLNKELRQLKSVEIFDNLTVDFKLTAPSAPFRTNLLGQSFLIPKHIWKDIENPQKASIIQNPELMTGSGPFIFQHWRRGEEIKLNANKDYFQTPKVDGIIHVIYSNHESAFFDFEKGKVDISQWQVLPEHANQADQLPHLEVVREKDIAARFLAMNIRKPPLDDINFRRALAHMIRYDHIVNVIFAGLAEISTTSIITSGNKFWHNPNLKEYEFDPELAKQILKEAGYGWDEKGRLHHPPK